MVPNCAKRHILTFFTFCHFLRFNLILSHWHWQKIGRQMTWIDKASTISCKKFNSLSWIHAFTVRTKSFLKSILQLKALAHYSKKFYEEENYNQHRCSLYKTKAKNKNVWLHVLIMLHMFQSEPTLYSCLNIKKFLAWWKRDIWIISESNGTQTHNHFVRKRKLNHLANK